MFSLTFSIEPSERDTLIFELWEAETAGITESEDWLRAFFDNDAAAPGLQERFRDFSPRWEPVEDHDWVSEMDSRWPSFPVGDRFYLVPDWRDDPAPCGRIRLRMHPGMAAGTGLHPATQLCLIALEKHVTEGAKVLDLGTGTGILAEAAHLLGAGSVIACDIDPASAGIASRNLDTGMYRIPVFAGSVRSVRANAIDLLVANLNAATLLAQQTELVKIFRPESKLILSGFNESEAIKIEQAYGRTRLDDFEMDGWICIVL